jgi:hypothetical protein
MTISQLITELQKLQAEHGDLPVTASWGEHGDHYEISEGVASFEPYDKVGSEIGYENAHIHLS